MKRAALLVAALGLAVAACGPAVAPLPAPPQSIDPPAGWAYTSSRDPMTDKMSREACVTSNNRVYLSPPYEPVKAMLCLRDSPQFGHDAYVQLYGDGQILCGIGSGCRIPIRFGRAPSVTFTGASASDGSSNIVFIQNRRRLEAGIQSAGNMIVQLEFYRNGVQTLDFPTANFAWPETAAPGG